MERFTFIWTWAMFYFVGTPNFNGIVLEIAAREMTVRRLHPWLKQSKNSEKEELSPFYALPYNVYPSSYHNVHTGIPPPNFSFHTHSGPNTLSLPLSTPHVQLEGEATLDGNTGQKPPKYRKNELVLTAEASLECPSQTVLSNSECIGYERTISKQGCREGWAFNGNSCTGVDVRPVSVFCEDGFSQHDGICKKQIVSPRQILCSDGFLFKENDCRQLVYSKPDFICPNGSYLKQDYCSKKVIESPQEFCPEEFKRETTHCERQSVTQPKYGCPYGYEKIASQCIRTTTQAGHFFCADGWHLQEQTCVHIVVNDPISVCRQGTLDYQTHLCVFKVIEEGKMLCPFGENLGDRCKVEKLLKQQNVCPYNSVLDAPKNVCIGHNSRFAMQPRCPDGFHTSGNGNCRRYEYTSLEQHCPEGYTKTDKSCEHMSYSNPEEKCSHGFVLNIHNGKCSKKEISPADFLCPQHFDRNGFICTQTEQVQVFPVCPQNLRLTATGCIRVETVELTLSCSMNLELKSSENGKPVCTGETKFPPTPICHPPFELRSGGQNVYTCVGEEHSLPQFSCANGFAINNGSCTREERQPLRQSCTAGYTEVADQCIRQLEEATVTLCPVGYKLYKGMCVNKVKTAPIPTCPSGFKYDRLVGSCYKVDIKFEFENSLPKEAALPLDEKPKDKPLEDLLSLKPEDESKPLRESNLPTTSRGNETPTNIRDRMPRTQSLPIQEGPLGAGTSPGGGSAANPTTVQIVQQPIPMPQPVVYLPPPIPLPPPLPPPPQPLPIPNKQSLFIPITPEQSSDKSKKKKKLFW